MPLKHCNNRTASNPGDNELSITAYMHSKVHKAYDETLQGEGMNKGQQAML